MCVREGKMCSHEKEKQSVGRKQPPLCPALARGGEPFGQEQVQPQVWPSMTHLEFAQFGWVTGGERKRQQASVPLLDQSPPAASSLHGSTSPSSPPTPTLCSLSLKFTKPKMHSIPLNTKQIHN